MRVFAADFQIVVALTFFAQFFRDTPKFLSAKSSFFIFICGAKDRCGAKSFRYGGRKLRCGIKDI